VESEEEVFEPVIRHELIAEEQYMELIPTTNYIRNFNVFYEEVVAEGVSEDDFLIIDANQKLRNLEVIDAEVVSPRPVDEDQMAFSFDLPLNEQSGKEDEERENVITFNLDEEVRDIDIQEHIEVIPVLDYKKEGETRYSLEDYMELENKLTGAKSKAEEFEPKIVEDELVFEKKTIPPAEEEKRPNQEVDPMNSSIEDMLRERADERRRKLKDFNYKFQNNLSNIDEIEKEPAYKRQGVNLDENPKEGKVSRTTLGEDSNDEIQLRSNNSFLHDNVD
jgi:cell division protein FtsZ